MENYHLVLIQQVCISYVNYGILFHAAYALTFLKCLKFVDLSQNNIKIL